MKHPSRKKNYYTPLSDAEYYARFGILYDEKNQEAIHINKEKLEKAFNKAWETRDFEINKFWTRSAYFGGFISAIFIGYTSIITGDSNGEAIKMHIDLYLILLGMLFSTAWLLAIKGSKSWQENWEAHIEKLEDYVTGPLYKTIYYNGKPYYSVSRISEFLAWVVIVTWVLLFIQNVIDKCAFIAEKMKPTILCTFAMLSIAATMIFILLLIFNFGQSSEKYKTKKRKFLDRKKKLGKQGKSAAIQPFTS
jgi:hypothetical protein